MINELIEAYMLEEDYYLDIQGEEGTRQLAVIENMEIAIVYIEDVNEGTKEAQGVISIDHEAGALKYTPIC